MFTAAQARFNVVSYEVTHAAKVANDVMAIAAEMGKSIEYRSKLGDKELEFYPFNLPQFSTTDDKKAASEMFEDIFEENGYEVLRNDPINNVFFVAW